MNNTNFCSWSNLLVFFQRVRLIPIFGTLAVLLFVRLGEAMAEDIGDLDWINVGAVTDMRQFPVIRCSFTEDAAKDWQCHAARIGKLVATFSPHGETEGVFSLLEGAKTRFRLTTNGKVIFFKNLEGGRDVDGNLSYRKIFCLNSLGKNYGLFWNGRAYGISDEFSEACSTVQLK